MAGTLQSEHYWDAHFSRGYFGSAYGHSDP
jgi:hypothetical protein